MAEYSEIVERANLLDVLTNPSSFISALKELLNTYCHEGLNVGKCETGGHALHCDIDRCAGQYVAGICSESATGKTPERAIRNLASKIQKKVHDGVLGC